MTIIAGLRLGSYEITAKLGEGGMGEVWRARDTKLGREVAIKVLPAAFSADPERLARFEREARILASLSHAGIAHLYGFEALPGGDGTQVPILVMELAEGEDLSVRLSRGPLPLEEAIPIARQIAEALEEAHEHGIIHRDLKPGNVRLASDGRVKVLDFGLARAMDPPGAEGGASTASPTLMNSPTLTSPATRAGVILGTAAYMSPEQAKGRSVDKRADVWAFGVLLHEMLTGKRLFTGDSIAETLAGVLKTEIDLSSLPPATPAAIRRLLGRCLDRDPKRRLRDIGEARVVLAGGFEDERVEPASTRFPSRARERIAFGLAAVFLALLGAVVFRRPVPVRVQALRLHLPPPTEARIGDQDPGLLSPDGRFVAFSLHGQGGESTLAVRALDSLETRKLPGTGTGYEPFWSPDGRALAFFGSHLERVDADGLQPPQKLAPIRDGRGGTWGRGGVIVYAPEPAGPLYRVDASGGEARPATVLDASRKESAHLRPWFLPDGKRFIYFVKSALPGVTGIWAGSLDGSPGKQVLPLDVSVVFAPPGFLLYVREGRLLARPFDADRLEVTGEPAVLATGLDYMAQYEIPPISTSETGRLSYRAASAAELRQIVRIDRGGNRLATIGEPGDLNLDLSPDGGRLAVTRLDPEKRRLAIWVYELARGVASRLGPDVADGPVWSPDGSRIAYVSSGEPVPRLCVRPASGGAEKVLWTDVSLSEPVDWSPDGRVLLVESVTPSDRMDLVLVPADGSGPGVPYVGGASDQASGRFSPDGQFVAYISNEGGRNEVYVEPVPRTGARWRLSGRGGDAPRWSGDGREVFYVEPGERDGSRTLVAVPVTPRAAELFVGSATPLTSVGSVDYEPARGGKEFLFGTPVRDAVSSPPFLVDNWPALLTGK